MNFSQNIISKITIKFALWGSLFCLPEVGYTQDFGFTQFLSTPLYLNPAFAGTTPQGRGVYHYKAQFPNQGGQFLTNYFSYDHNFPNQRNSLGVMVTSDKAGLVNFKSFTFDVMYAHLVPFNETNRLKLSISGGFGQKSINYVNLFFGDQLSPSGTNGLPTSDPTLNGTNLEYADVSTGALFYNEKVWLGISAHHLNQPEQSLGKQKYRLPARYSVHGGMKISIQDDRNAQAWVSPAFSYRYQGQTQLLDAGANFHYEQVFAGIWANNLALSGQGNTGVAMTAGVHTPKVRISYSYNYILGALAGKGNIHEIGISVQLGDLLDFGNIRYIHCPAVLEGFQDR
jgi:type IX secretion system PorP/SprF family membrane protein